MGLIAKAVDKLEAKEGPADGQENRPGQDKWKRRGRKRFLLLTAALLLMGAVSAAGYLAVLRPSSEPQPTVTRRSINARKKMAERGRTPATKEQQTSTLKGQPDAGPNAAAQADQKPGAGREPLQRAKETARSGSKPAEPEGQAGSGAESIQSPLTEEQPAPTARLLEEMTAMSQSDEASGSVDDGEGQRSTGEPKPFGPTPQDLISETQQQPNIPPPSTDQQEDAGAQQGSGKDQETVAGTEVIPSVEEDPGWDMTDQGGWDQFEEEPTEEIVAVHPAEPPPERASGHLQITQRSESRAHRYYKKGLSYQRQEQLSQAIDAYRRALSLNPDHPEANMNLAIAYLQAGRLKEAEQILVYLYASKPKDCEVLYNFGLLLYQSGELASAESKLERLLEIDPFHLQANLLLAGIYEEMGELDRALRSCQKAYRINSADARVLYRLGRVWDLAGEPEKAVEFYRLFLNTSSETRDELELAVRDRLKYLSSKKGEK